MGRVFRTIGIRAVVEDEGGNITLISHFSCRSNFGRNRNIIGIHEEA